MQIPALIEAGDERVPDVRGVCPPRSMDGVRVLVGLGRGQVTARRCAMRSDRHDVGRAVGQPDPGAGERDLHHVLREIARGMGHVLECAAVMLTEAV